MTCGLQALNILLALDLIGSHCPERLEIALTDRIAQVGCRPLRGNQLLTCGAQGAVAWKNTRAGNAGKLVGI